MSTRLFKNELAMILGVLASRHFSGKLFKDPTGRGYGGGGSGRPGLGPPGFNNPIIPTPSDGPLGDNTSGGPGYGGGTGSGYGGEGYSYGGNGGLAYKPTIDYYVDNSIVDIDRIDGMGRGGYFQDYNGEAGKTGYTDDNFESEEPSISGNGGTLTQGGNGATVGKLFTGGNDKNARYLMSAGGGAGLYGGGSGMLAGGGGGGSSFVLSDFGLALISDEAKSFLQKNKNWETYKGEWVDAYLSETVHECQWLYDLNTAAEEDFKLYEGVLGGNYLELYNLRKRVNNNGCVMVSNVNETIKLTAEDGLTGLSLGYIYDSDEVITWQAPATGTYHFICYGACGGDVNPEVKELRGGYGGVASGKFYLQAGTTLYFIIGRQGQKEETSIVGGGVGLGSCTGGGGCTVVKYTSNIDDMSSAMIVAGGGGGIFSLDEGELDIKNLHKIIPSAHFKENKIEKYDPEQYELIIDDIILWVNDTSTVHVLTKSYGQLEIPEYARMHCSIYINDGDEGELHLQCVPLGGTFVNEFQFDLSKLYPENTPTHEVKVMVKIKMNYFTLIAKDGVLVWATTQDRATDIPVKNTTKIKNNIDVIDISEIYEIELEQKGEATTDFIDDVNIDDEDGVFDLKVVNLSYINREPGDEIENEDFVDVNIKGPVYIQIVVDESTPYGNVDESSYVIYDSEKTFTAYPNDTYLVEWYLDDILISTENSIIVKGDIDKTFVVKFISTEEPDIPDVPTTNNYSFADLDYVQDGISIAYDLIYNTKEGHKDTLFALQDLAYDEFIVDTEYVPQTESDIRFDGIINSEDGHATSLTEWKDIAGLV